MNERQCTLKEEICFSGKGLHTGHPVSMTIRPAKEDMGIQFERIDLEDTPNVDTILSNVFDTNRGTTLKSGRAIIHTVEHALAALCGMGIDNASIILDAPEPPAFDGSSTAIADEIHRVGKVQQSSMRKCVDIKNPFSFEDDTTGSKYTVVPHDHMSFDVELKYSKSTLGTMYAQLDDLASFHQEVSPARSFCLLEEIESLLSQNLIQGGDLTTGLVLTHTGNTDPTLLEKSAKQGLIMQPSLLSDILVSNPLHFQNEPARHKLLDLIGDLSLLGCRINGKIKAFKPGHTSNIAFAKKIRQLYDLRS